MLRDPASSALINRHLESLQRLGILANRVGGSQAVSLGQVNNKRRKVSDILQFCRNNRQYFRELQSRPEGLRNLIERKHFTLRRSDISQCFFRRGSRGKRMARLEETICCNRLDPQQRKGMSADCW